MLQGHTANARRLRQTMTFPEFLLWRELKQLRPTLKFRRQHPAGAYVLDFYCHQARLAVEVDGEVHDRGDRPARDMERDAHFAARGILTLRLSAKSVLDDLPASVDHVRAVALERQMDPPL
jgi:very-short-patch-repair endonuclease